MFHNQHSLHQLPFAYPDVAKKKVGYVSYVRLSYLTISKLHAIEYSVEFIQKKKKMRLWSAFIFQELTSKASWEKPKLCK